MAGIFDDLRNKGSGLLGDLNNFLFTDNRTQEQKEASTYGFNESTEGLQNVYQNESKTAFTPTVKPIQSKNPNAQVPNPQNTGENTFLGAVGEYFNNAQKTWKDKGGFDALMSNPQFGIGLSLLQQASEGKTIGASALKAMVDGGVISNAYAKKIAARGSVTGPATAQQIEAVKAKLAASGLAGKPTYGQQLLDIFKGESTTAKQDMAYAEIYKEAEKKAKNAAKTGKEVNIDDYLEDAARDYIASNKGVVGGSGFGILGEKSITKRVDTTKQKIVGERQLGGPVTQGKAYLVGEIGPEVFIPKETGKIVSTDDSKIINLLLESNPQLKNVSPARAEKILRNRFPDYFE